MPKPPPVTLEDLYALKPKAIWRQFWSEHFSFWAICGYLFFEYVRPQSIIPAIDILPWASLFLLLAFIGAVFDPTVKWVKLAANKWLIIYLVVIGLSIIGARFPNWSYENLKNFYLWLPPYFLIINIVNTRKRFFLFLGIFVLASFKLSLGLALVWAGRGFTFTSWGLSGPPGFFENSGELAIQMCIFFPVAYVIAISLRPHIGKVLGLVLLLIPVTAVLTVLGASSRGGQLALVLQMLIMFYRKLFRFKSLVALVLLGAAVFNLLPDEAKDRLSKSGSDQTSLQRIMYWKGGLEMMNDHPLLGVGYFNFPPYFERAYPESLIYGHAQLPHNIFIQVGADLGYLGLFVYFMMILSCFVRRDVSNRYLQLNDRFMSRLAWAFNVSILGFLVAGQFVSVVYYPFMWIHLAFVGALKNIANKESAI